MREICEGDVIGPASVAVDGNVAVYDGTTGKLLKDGGTVADMISSSWGNIRILATSGGSYTTLESAIADAANWTVLGVMPGTYTYNTVTLPTGKTIRGLGSAEECILQSTNTTDGAAVVTVGGAGCVLQDLTMQCGGGAGVTSKIAGSTAIICRDVTWLYRATQGWSFECPLDQSGGEINNYCAVDMFNDAAADGFVLHGITVTNNHPTTTFRLFSSPARALCSCCDFVASSANQELVFSGTNTADILFGACSLRGTWNEVMDATIKGSVSIVGCDLGGIALGDITTIDSTVIRLAGNTNYGAVPTASCADGITWDVQDYLVQRVTDSSYTVKGFESRIEVDRDGAGNCAITLDSIAKHGTGTLCIASTDESATPSPIMITRAGADTIGQSGSAGIMVPGTSQRLYATQQHLLLGRDLSNSCWTIENSEPTMDVARYGTSAGLTQGKCYYLDTAGAWAESDASAEATSGGMLLGLALNATVAGGVLLKGHIVCGYLDGWNEGLLVYVSETSGRLTTTKPAGAAGSGVIVRPIGYCLNRSNEIFFDGTSFYYHEL